MYQQSKESRISLTSACHFNHSVPGINQKLQVELTPQQEAISTLQTQLEGVTAECNSLRKEIEKLECELGALSDLDFSPENFSFLTNIL